MSLSLYSVAMMDDVEKQLFRISVWGVLRGSFCNFCRTRVLLSERGLHLEQKDDEEDDTGKVKAEQRQTAEVEKAG